MRGRDLRQALQQGKRVYGTALEGYGQPRWARFFAKIGLDYVFLDSEHTPQNRETIAWAVQAYSAYNIAPLVRIPEISASHAAMVLDAGAHGVIVPYVETVEQVKAMVGAVKYRPLKGKTLQHALDTGEFPNEETRDYLQQFNPDAFLVIMIESPIGVANLPDLLAVGGVDAVLMGPHDLSVSYGVPEAYDHPRFEQAVQTVIQTCRAYDVGVGVHFFAGTMERAMRWINWGSNFICQRADTVFIAQGYQQELSIIREQLGDMETQSVDLDAQIAAGHGQ